ncbi:MAG: U32 family peptidase [Oscillospiraceae bacterium]|nr:U32 family peptidase [Oscillospiraceae bacterium]
MTSKAMIEVLSPAGGRESLSAAVGAGANAVYLGLGAFSARGTAENFTEDTLAEAVGFAHKKSVKVYLTLNTLLFDRELPRAKELLATAKNVGVDAVIVQDLAAASIAKDTGLSLHGSTQMSVSTAEGADVLRRLGFTRVVLARELSLREIAALNKKCEIETEVFVHGALCVSVSGQCLISAFLGGRSANRGFCAGTCRLDRECGGNKFALSLKDLSILDSIPSLERVGVASVKIEGRLKSPQYVAAATKACKLAACGKPYDKAHLAKVFSRGGFTDGYLTGEMNDMLGTRI